MVSVLQWVFGALIIASTVMSSIYSYRARRSADPRERGLNAARMNMSMGLMLILIAVPQMFYFTGSSVKVVVSALFLLLGLFNLFAGLRNRSHFNRMQ